MWKLDCFTLLNLIAREGGKSENNRASFGSWGQGEEARGQERRREERKHCGDAAITNKPRQEKLRGDWKKTEAQGEQMRRTYMWGEEEKWEERRGKAGGTGRWQGEEGGGAEEITDGEEEEKQMKGERRRRKGHAAHVSSLPWSQHRVLAARSLTDRPYGFIMTHTHTHTLTRIITPNTQTQMQTLAGRSGGVWQIEWRERGGGCNGTLSFPTSGGWEGEPSWPNYWVQHGHTDTRAAHTRSRTPILNNLGKLGEHNLHYQTQGEQIFGIEECKSQYLRNYSTSSR